jgi:hypothetical protein
MLNLVSSYFRKLDAGTWTWDGGISVELKLSREMGFTRGSCNEKKDGRGARPSKLFADDREPTTDD